MSGPPRQGRPGAEAVGPPVPEETAEDLYERAPCGYLSTLPDGTIIKVNQTLLSWLGHRRRTLVGVRRFSDLLTIGGRIYYETHIAPLLAMQGSVREIAVDAVRTDGSQLSLLVNAVLVRTDDGTPHVIRISVFDATDRREYERELLRARGRAEASEARARELATTLQANLLPPSIPEIPGLLVAGAYRPAGAGDDVGGDFYDVFETGRDDYVVVVGDVRGKGARAAAVTALARHTMRAAAIRDARPSTVLRTLNEALRRDRTNRFCTVVYLRVRFDRRRRLKVTMASAGHALPLLVTPDGAEPVGRYGSLLGVFDEPELQETTIALGEDQALFCFTDGLTEGRRGREFFGEQRLRALVTRLAGGSLAELPDAVVEHIVQFQRGDPRDDMAAVVIGRAPPAPTL